MNSYLRKIQALAPVEVLSAYCVHVTIGVRNFHLFACRANGDRVWDARSNKLVRNAECAQVFPDIELHDLYVNSLFTATEVQTLAEYFYETYGIEITVGEQPFPLPLPYAYGYLEFLDDQSEPYDHTVGDPQAKLPFPLLAFIHHMVGECDEVWTESNFAEDFTAHNRLDIIANSFVLEPENDSLPLNFPVFAYAETDSLCFFDQLRAVHNNNDENVSEEMRFCEHVLKFTNQEIIEFAYFIKDTVDELTRSHAKLFFEQANCFDACFYKIREMLKLVDTEYLAQHPRIIEFYRDGRELSTDSDRLWWEAPEEKLISVAGKTFKLAKDKNNAEIIKES